MRIVARGAGHWAAVVGVLALAAGGGRAAEVRHGPVAASPVERAAAHLARGFVPNRGQWDRRAAFAAPGFFGTTWVARDGELRHVLVGREDRDPEPGEAPARPGRVWVLGERLEGAAVRAITPEQEMGGSTSYFRGDDARRHRTGLPVYGRLSLGEVYPGIRLWLTATQKTVEKVFEAAPGADPTRIAVRVEGALGLRLGAGGELVARTGEGDVVFSRPRAWQWSAGVREPVDVAYELDAERSVYRFALGEHDPERPLFIDPLVQSTFLGGGDQEEALGLAVSPASGDVYVAGWTGSSDFPATWGGAQQTKDWDLDAYVARLSGDLGRVLQATYFGGEMEDRGTGVALGPGGEVYLVGYTRSVDLPGTSGAAQPASAGDLDVFVARFSPDLRQLVRATYLGGGDWDEAAGIAVSGSGDVYVAGFTFSTDFPGTAGAAQPQHSGSERDGFVARLDGGLTRVVRSTYLGGVELDEVRCLALAQGGDVYAAGYTISATDFPGTAGGAQERFGGWRDAFVARLDAGLTRIVQASYLGGATEETARAIAVGPDGTVYVTGETNSSENFPGTAGGAQPAYGGPDHDGFVTRFDAGLTRIMQSTFLGGSGDDQPLAVAVGRRGEVLVAGSTWSTDLPARGSGAQSALAAQYDGFAARLSPDLTQWLRTTYLGGTSVEEVRVLAVDPSSGDLLAAGWTGSGDFPGSAGGAGQSYAGGGMDAFVARLSSDLEGEVGDLWIPVVADIGGVGGSHFYSDLAVLNLGDDPATAGLEYHPEGGSTVLEPGLVQIPPGGQAMLRDVVGLLDAGGTKGVLRLLVDRPALVVSRVYNRLGEGNSLGLTPGTTFGQFMDGARAYRALSSGQSGFLVGLTQNAAYRTNIAVANVSSGEATARVTLYGASTAERLASYEVALSPGELRQENQPFARRAGRDDLDSGFAVVEVTEGAGVVAYASVVDSTATGGEKPSDPTTIPLKEAASSGAELWVPVVAEIAGAGGSHFYSDLALLNLAAAPADVSLTYFPEGGSSVTFTHFASVPASGQVILRDIVGQLGQAGSKGTLKIVSSQPLLAASRTYNRLAEGNSLGLAAGTTFGQYVEVYPLGETLAAGERAYLAGLTESAAFRTNLAVANFGTGPASVLVTLHSGDGAELASYRVDLAPGELRQDNRVFVTRAGREEVESGWAEVTVSSGDGVVAYASVLDNTATGGERPSDPTTIPMKR